MILNLILDLFFIFNLNTKLKAGDRLVVNQTSKASKISNTNKISNTSKDSKIVNLDLSKYSDLALRSDNKPKAVKIASAKIVSPKQSDFNPPADLEPLFDKYSSQYGVSKALIKKIAQCESGFNPKAVNGPYAGMYQFLASTWISQRKIMGEDPNPELRFNAKEAVKTTAFKISRDGAGAWSVCGR